MASDRLPVLGRKTAATIAACACVIGAGQVLAQWEPFQRIAASEVPAWSAADLVQPKKAETFEVKPPWSALGSDLRPTPAKRKPPARVSQIQVQAQAQAQTRAPIQPTPQSQIRIQTQTQLNASAQAAAKTRQTARPAKPIIKAQIIIGRGRRTNNGTLRSGSGRGAVTEVAGGSPINDGMSVRDDRDVEIEVVDPERPAPNEVSDLDLTAAQPQTVFIEQVVPGPDGPRGAFYCTGVVIGLNRVLTAAHCVRPRMRIGYGGIARDSLAEEAIVRAEVLEALPHPLYGTDQWHGHDLAVLRIEDHTPPEFMRRAQQVAIMRARTFVMKPKSQLEVVGYGLTDPNNENSWGERLQAAVNVASAACIEEWAAAACSAFREFVLSNVIGPRPGSAHRDTCNGDSGGPAFVSGPPPRVLVGITSRGFPAPGEESCGLGGIYGMPGTEPNLLWLKSLVPDLLVAADDAVAVAQARRQLLPNNGEIEAGLGE